MSWVQSNIILLIAFYTAAAVHFHTTCATLILSLMKQDLSTSEDFNQDEMLDKLYGGNKKIESFTIWRESSAQFVEGLAMFWNYYKYIR